MNNYMDASHVVANNTVISYSGKHSVIKLPERFANIAITKIGDGSFMESSDLQCVVLPPQIKEIGAQAFNGCPMLTSVFIPGGVVKVGMSAFANCNLLTDITVYDLELTPEEYSEFKEKGYRCYEDVYVLSKIPQNPLIKRLAESINNARPANNIPDDIPLLFQLVNLDEERGKFSLEKNIPVIGFTVPSVPTTENKAFCDYIKNGVSESYLRAVDQENDRYVRMGSMPTKEKTVIFTFDNSKTKKKNKTYLIHATLRIGYFFWQSAQPIIYENEMYHIYRRYYLSSNPIMQYVRRDIAVYSKNGLVTDRTEAQNVYAKYKLLSIL